MAQSKKKKKSIQPTVRQAQTKKQSVKSPMSLELMHKRALAKSQKLVETSKQLPSWVKTRPEAVRQWQADDRKKKKYRTFRLQKRIKPEPRYIPSSWQLIKDSLRFLATHRWKFLGLMLIYAVFYFIVVWSPASLDVSTLKSSVETALGDATSGPVLTAAVAGAVIATPREASNPTVGAALLLGISLVIIFAIRELTNGEKIKVRDAYYRGLAPIIPVVCILLVVALQLLPFAIASFVYATARTGGVFVTGFEDLSFFIVTLLIGLLSFYFITSSALAFYIATLPGMYPVAALRAAKKVVQFQRFKVFKRFITLPILLGVIYLTTLLLSIRFLPNQTYIIMDVYAIAIIPFVNVYLYKLYRSLI